MENCAFAPVNVEEYIAEISPSLKPPVANRVWFKGPQFFVMIVGGPNKRDDFHFQPGEELFWQLRGDMCLDVMEDGCRRKVPIKEGEMFLLPSNTHHSPQRFANTIGLVCERIRSPEDIDFLKWFVPNTDTILYEESFHCSDIGSQLKIVIENFFASPQSEILKTTPKNEIGVSSIYVPFHLNTRIDEVRSSPAVETVVNGEFVVRILSGSGSLDIPIWQGDSFLYQRDGAAGIDVVFDGHETSSTKQYTLESGNATWFPRQELVGSKASITMLGEDSCLMIITCVCCLVE